jgi:hypothetical protein
MNPGTKGQGIPLSSMLRADTRTAQERLDEELIASLRREVVGLEAELETLKRSPNGGGGE